MSKTTLVAVGAALGGTILGIGITVALLPPPTLPPEIPSTSTPRATASRPVESGRSSFGGESPPATKPKAAEPVEPSSAKSVADMVGALRSAGVTDNLIAEVLVAQLNAQRRDRQREWQARIARGEADPKSLSAMYQGFVPERDALLRSQLGEEAFRTWDKQNYAGRVERLKLSPEDADALYRLQKEAEARSQEIVSRFNAGELDQADYQAQVAAAIKEQEERFKDLLGADRYAQYKFGLTPTMASARWYLRELKLGDSQLEALDRADQQLAQRNQELQQQELAGTLKGDFWKEFQTAQAAREAEYQRILSPRDWAEYQKQQNPGYQQMLKFAPAWQLSKADADYVYGVLQQHQQAVTALSTGGTTNDLAGRAEQIKALDAQAAQTLQNHLGADRYARMKKANVIQLHSP